MKHREPISTESYHYRVDESRRQAIQQHFDRDRLARINRGEQPGQSGWWALMKRRVRRISIKLIRGSQTLWRNNAPQSVVDEEVESEYSATLSEQSG